MDKNTKERVLVEELFDEFYKKIEASDLISISDIYVHLDLPQGDLVICDEEENCSVRKSIYNWIVRDEDKTEETKSNALSIIRASLLVMQNKGYFDRQLFQLPVSVLYANDANDSYDELLLIDDEWIGLDMPLMRGVDSELDAFFSRLMDEK